MNRKLSLIVAALCGYGMVETAQATPCPKLVEFYAGVSGGIEQLSGFHSDSFAVNAAPEENRVFADKSSFPSSNKGTVITGMTGILWNIPTLPFYLAPEIYIGKGDRESTFRVNYVDNFPVPADNRTYSSLLQRKSFYGALLKAGYKFYQTYTVYISAGLDVGNFSITRSMTKDVGIPDTNTSTVRTNKSFTGLLWGIGFEKQMGSFKVSLDFKGVNYGRKNFVDAITTTNGTPGLTTLGYTAKPKIYAGSIGFAYLF
ncbi:MAG: hypothetical protein K2Y18_01360 [Alphaproteobacteria bacterium]|jgi:opacity protein-like surface antigen|nr:hypothetical protein [Alphaproteobacteria bacterium]